MFPLYPRNPQQFHSKKKRGKKKRVCCIFDHRPRKRWQGWLKWIRKMNKEKEKKKEQEETKHSLHCRITTMAQAKAQKKKGKKKSREQILDANKGEKEQITNNVSIWFWYGCLTGIWLTNCAFWAFSPWSALLYYFLKNENQQVRELKKKSQRRHPHFQKTSRGNPKEAEL